MKERVRLADGGGAGSGRLAFANGEGGFTTPAVAVALLLACSLLFITMHGYSVGTRSGQVQYVADAGALAGDAVVAEFVTAGQVVDALLLSCSLVALCVSAASAVAAFIPGGAAAASELAQVAGKVVDFRKKFAESATKGLNRVQELLPALIAVRAYMCIEANAQASGLEYTGTAIAFPSEGVEVSLSDASELEETCDEIEGREDEIALEVESQSEAQEELDAAKQDAWLADCGNSGMSMRERAATLAGLSAASNPDYASADLWSFSVPLARAKAYYAARYAAEEGESYDGTPDEVSESIARKRFYKYALEEVSEGSVTTSESGSEVPDLKYLARNTAQIKETELYTEAIYPVSVDEDGVRTIHSYTGCPAYAQGSAAGLAAVSAVDEGSVNVCETCQFSATTLGRVPSASTSIDNGFEYYYRAVVEASERYCEALDELEESSAELQTQASEIADLVSSAASAIAAQRYDPQPPGRYGCVCIVYASAGTGSSLPFAGAVSGLSERVAISAATLAPDEADDQGSVVSDIAEGLMPQAGSGSSVLHAALSAWSTLLVAYTSGTDGVADAFDATLGAIPLVGTELSSSVSSALSAALESAGLEPADLSSYKPVVVNSAHVLQRDGGTVANALLQAKNAADAYGTASSGDLDVLAEQFASVTGLDEAVQDDALVVVELPFSELGLSVSSSALSLSVPSDFSSCYESAADVFELLGGSGS